MRGFLKGVRATFEGDFQINWTAAEKKAISNILKHYNPLIGALNEMGKQFTEDGSPSLFSKDSNTKNKAIGMAFELTDKNLVIFLHYLRDILDVIKSSSLEFQKRYGILMDKGKNMEALTTSLQKLGNHNGGHCVSKFLETCMCGPQKTHHFAEI